MVSILIINYKQKDLLEACVKSIMNHVHSVPYEIIVVNNCNDDLSMSVSDKIKIIQNENKGFSQANNLAASKAGFEYLLFLNADTEILSDPFENIFEKINKLNYGAIGFKLFNPDRTFQLSFGKFTGLLNELHNKKQENIFRKRNIDLMKKTELEYESITEVDWVTGASLFIKKRTFNEISGFNERFFLFYEDIDLCKRLTEKGYTNFFFPYTKILHHKGENIDKTFKTGNYFHSKVSQLLYYKLHRNFMERILLRLYLIATHFIKYITIFEKIHIRIIKLCVLGSKVI